MNDLKGLAQRDNYNVSSSPTLDEIANRIGMLVGPYAFELGVDPVLASKLVWFCATAAAGIIRESQITQLRAQTVVVRDERG